MQPSQGVVMDGGAAPARGGSSRGAAAGVDLLVFLGVSFGVYAVESVLRQAGLFPLPQIFDGVPTVLSGFATVLLLGRARGIRAGDLGLRRPRRWWWIPAWGAVVLLVHVASQLTVAPVLGHLLGAPEPDLGRYEALRANLPLFLMTASGAMITGGFMEEVIYRGFVIHRLHRLLGGGRRASWAAALLNGLPFGIAHLAWGFGGIVVTTVMGSILGVMYLVTGRNLWPLIAAHATLDFLLIWQAYAGALG